MKKIILLLAISVCMCCYVTAQSTDDLSGRYYMEDSNYYFEINNGNFRLVQPNPPLVIRSSELVASGTVKRIDDSFVELNSYETPTMTVARDLKITQTTVSGLKDSINVKFTIPYKYDKLRITLYTDIFNPYDFEYSTENTTIRIPNTVKSFSLYVVPEQLFPHTSYGSFYGIVAYDSLLEYSIEEGANFIEIEIPVMDNSFFEKYYVEHEYARVTENSIIWKGVTYRKVTGRELKKKVQWEREKKERREAGLKGK